MTVDYCEDDQVVTTTIITAMSDVMSIPEPVKIFPGTHCATLDLANGLVNTDYTKSCLLSPYKDSTAICLQSPTLAECQNPSPTPVLYHNSACKD